MNPPDPKAKAREKLFIDRFDNTVSVNALALLKGGKGEEGGWTDRRKGGRREEGRGKRGMGRKEGGRKERGREGWGGRKGKERDGRGRKEGGRE